MIQNYGRGGDTMNESILWTIKKMLGVQEMDDYFDTDIMVHINSSLMAVNQLGIGVEDFVVFSQEQQWSDFLKEGDNYEAIKNYIYIRTRLVFDPPTNSFIVEALNKTMREIEWRLYAKADNKIREEVVNGE